MTNCNGRPSSVNNLIFFEAVVCAVNDALTRRSAATAPTQMHRAMLLKNSPCVASTCVNFVSKSQVCSSSATLRRAFVQFIQRTLGAGLRVEDGLTKDQTAQRIQPGIGSCP